METDTLTMYTKVLQDWTKEFLSKVESYDFPENTYLAGGTAIALQLGHRKSVDLDFFTPTKFEEIQWQQHWEERFKFKLAQIDKQTIVGTIKKVKLSLMGFKYKLILPPEVYKDILVASLPDLAAMKLNTIMGRGAKRDFIDIYFLAKEYGLKKLLEFYGEKFGNLEEKEIMIKKGLIYFEYADKEYMPDMLVPTDWKKIKQWFISQIRNI